MPVITDTPTETTLKVGILQPPTIIQVLPEARNLHAFDFYLFLMRRRDLYVEAKPAVAALDAKNGHSNFGLDIESKLKKTCLITTPYQFKK